MKVLQFEKTERDGMVRGLIWDIIGMNQRCLADIAEGDDLRLVGQHLLDRNHRCSAVLVGTGTPDEDRMERDHLGFTVAVPDCLSVLEVAEIYYGEMQ